MPQTCVESLERRALLSTAVAGFAETAVVEGLARPTQMEFAPDGRLFVSEKSGRLRVVKDGQLLPTPFVTLPVEDSGERGLSGIAFDPNFATNRFIYVYWTAKDPTVHNRLSRFTADPNNPDVALPGSEVDLIDLPTLGPTNHNGGGVHFGPDGKLYVSVGENGNPANAQSLTTTLGKILRINKDGSIPPDNPFYKQTTGQNRAIWALGLRNPYTFTFQPGTGRMFINDVGQDTWEEVDEGAAGANYGWPQEEGPSSDPRFTAPLYAYRHGARDETGGCAIVGGAFYNPPADATRPFPAEYVGDYFYADYCAGFIKSIDLSNGGKAGTVATFATDLSLSNSGAAGVSDLHVGPDGSLYAVDDGFGVIYRFDFTATATPALVAPPQNRVASVGRPATFAVVANGTAPFAYQWQRDGVDIPGATAASYTLPSAELADNGAQFRVVVSNVAGTITSAAATLTVTAAQPPSAAITLPADGATYHAGDVISFSGSATDPQDGALPAAAFNWSVVFHHEDHTHPFIDTIPGVTEGTFTIPSNGETSADVFYTIHLAVTDSAGLTTEVTREIHPLTSTVTLATNVPGLELTLDGQPVDSGTTFTGVRGVTRSLGAPASQTAGGVVYDFVSWSDGGAISHLIPTPDADTTFTATYQPRVGSADGPDLTAAVAGDLPGLVVGRDKGKVVVRVGNSGNVAFNGTTSVRLLLSTDGTPDDGDVLIRTLTPKLKLKPTAVKALKVSFAYPSVDDGNYVLLAEVDPANMVAESEESNNVGTTQPIIVRKPVIDLSATFVTPTPAAVKPGKRSSVALSLFNSGNVTAKGKMTVTLFAATDSTGAGGAMQMGSRVVSVNLKAGKRTKVKMSFVPPAGLAAGTYYFSAAVDAGSQLAESDEANNLAVSTGTFTVT